MTNQLAQVGQFCPNEACESYGEIEVAQIMSPLKELRQPQRARVPEHRVTGKTRAEPSAKPKKQAVAGPC